MKYKFIKTSDENTKSELLDAGFELITQEGSVFVFLNNHIVTFEDKNKKIQYSNMLYV